MSKEELERLEREKYVVERMARNTDLFLRSTVKKLMMCLIHIPLY